MRIKEFQTLKSSCFVQIPFSTFWSYDNYVATATDKGVHIMEIMFSGSSKDNEIAVHRWFLKPRQAAPTQGCCIDTARLLDCMDIIDTFLYFQDQTLSPTAPLTGFSPSIKAVSWSPPSKVADSSLLAVLTDAGSLDLYVPDYDVWAFKGSVSDGWAENCRKDWDDVVDTIPSAEVFLTLKSRAYKIKLTAFTWGYVDEDENLTIFSCNMVNDVMMWKIEKGESNKLLSITLLAVIITDLEYGTSLSCAQVENNSCLLLVCSLSGKIQCLNMEGNKETSRSLVWSDMDQLQVPPKGISTDSREQGIIFIIPKGGYFLVLWLDKKANLNNFFLYNTEDIAITGMSWLSNGDLMATSRCGDIFLINIDISQDQLDVKVDKIHLSLRSNAFSCQGIAFSRNSAILTFPYSVCAAYDHLVLKEQSHIVFCSLLEYLDIDANFILRSETDRLYDHWDYLEMIRLECVQKNTEVAYCLDMTDSFDSMSINKLKKIYWYSQFSLLVTTLNERIGELKELIKSLKQAIISYYLFLRLNSLTEENLNNMYRASLPVVKKWLEYLKLMGPDFQSIKYTASIVHNQISGYIQDVVETCAFCDSEVENVTEELFMECRSGHKVPRCMKTLLPVHNPPYYVCKQCGEVSLLGGADDNRCVMCDGKLQLENSLKDQ